MLGLPFGRGEHPENESTKVPNARRAACIFTNPCTKSIADQQVHTPAYKSMHMLHRIIASTVRGRHVG